MGLRLSTGWDLETWATVVFLCSWATLFVCCNYRQGEGKAQSYDLAEDETQFHAATPAFGGGSSRALGDHPVLDWCGTTRHRRWSGKWSTGSFPSLPIRTAS